MHLLFQSKRYNFAVLLKSQMTLIYYPFPAQVIGKSVQAGDEVSTTMLDNLVRNSGLLGILKQEAIVYQQIGTLNFILTSIKGTFPSLLKKWTLIIIRWSNLTSTQGYGNKKYCSNYLCQIIITVEESELGSWTNYHTNIYRRTIIFKWCCSLPTAPCT